MRDSAVTAQYRVIVSRSRGEGRRGGITIYKLPVVIPPLEVFVANGWYDGGHRFYPAATIVRHEGVVAVIRPQIEGADYNTTRAFTGNTVHEIERKRHKPDLDITPAIAGHLRHLRDSDSLDQGALLELTYLLVTMLHAETNVSLLAPLKDIDQEAIEATAASRGWTTRISRCCAQPSGRAGGRADGGGPSDREVTRCVFDSSPKELRIRCAARIMTQKETRVDRVVLESDYEAIRLMCKTVRWHSRMIR
jgi:hypothetical protein